METLQFCLRKIIYGIPLVIGATLISFVLMVYFGPDKTYDLLGKNPTKEQIAEIRHELGYDRPFPVRYTEYLKDLLTFNFGNSDSSGEQVTSIFKNTIPVSLAVQIPGFILGDLIAVLMALLAAYYRGSWIDKGIMTVAVIGMSISVLIVIIGFQIIFCSSYGLDLFPVQGWDVNGPLDYLKYVTVPTLASVFVALGYNARFYRAIIAEEMNRDHVRTAKAFGCSPAKLLFKHVLKNCMIPIVTRVVLTLPFLLIGGSILIESYFSIPGIGLTTYNAITTGDQPVLKAVVGMSAVLFVATITLQDILYQLVDPRIALE